MNFYSLSSLLVRGIVTAVKAELYVSEPPFFCVSEKLGSIQRAYASFLKACGETQVLQQGLGYSCEVIFSFTARDFVKSSFIALFQERRNLWMKALRWIALQLLGFAVVFSMLQGCASVHYEQQMAAEAAPRKLASRPRLMLAITESFGTSDGSQCELNQGSTKQQASLTLTENDVAAWEPYGARWMLDPTRYNESNMMGRLSGHCFVLSIDGKVVSSGVVLWVYTGQLTGYDTLNVIPKDGTLTLQLTRGNHRNISLLHAQALGEILGGKPPIQSK